MGSRLYWVSADGQGEIDCGVEPEGCDRVAFQDAALAELLEQCGEDEQREAIEAGRLVWTDYGYDVADSPVRERAGGEE